MSFDKNPETINRKGRPPKEKCLTNLMKQHLENIPKGSEKTNKQIFIEQVYSQAMKGDTVCQRLIWNYLDGMPKQSMELSGDQVFIEDIRERFKNRNGDQ